MLIHKCQWGNSFPFSQIGRKLRPLPLSLGTLYCVQSSGDDNLADRALLTDHVIMRTCCRHQATFSSCLAPMVQPTMMLVRRHGKKYSTIIPKNPQHCFTTICFSNYFEIATTTQSLSCDLQTYVVLRSVKPRLHQIHVAGHKYPGRTTCIGLNVDGYKF